MAAIPTRSSMKFHGFTQARFIAVPLAINEGMGTEPDRLGHTVEWD